MTVGTLDMTTTTQAMLALLTMVQEAAVKKQTLWEFLVSGGPVMVPIGLCSVVAMAFALERWRRLRAVRVLPASAEQAIELVRAGRAAEALPLVDGVPAPLPRILAAGLRRRGFALRDIEGAMEDQAQKEFERLRGNIRPLTIIAYVSPLLGLLGTVVGIQEAFQVVVKTGMGKPEHLAAGIEQALVTTIAGLVVAIPTYLVATHLQGKARRLIQACDDKLSPLVEMLARPAEESRAA